MTLSLIVAHTQNRVIGADNDMPWHYPEDLKHFKRVTSGHAIIMGRKSCESLPKALPKRRNIVVTRQADYQREGFEVFHDLQEAIAAAASDDSEPFIIGGGEIYKLAMPLVDRMFITEIQKHIAGDTYFPDYNAEEWIESERSTDETGELIFRCLERKSA